MTRSDKNKHVYKRISYYGVPHLDTKMPSNRIKEIGERVSRQETLLLIDSRDPNTTSQRSPPVYCTPIVLK